MKSNDEYLLYLRGTEKDLYWVSSDLFKNHWGPFAPFEDGQPEDRLSKTWFMNGNFQVPEIDVCTERKYIEFTNGRHRARVLIHHLDEIPVLIEDFDLFPEEWKMKYVLRKGHADEIIKMPNLEWGNWG